MDWKKLIFLFCCCTAFISCDRDVSVFCSDEWEFRHEDEEKWTDDIPLHSGNYRMRTTIDIDDSVKPSVSYSLFIDMLASTTIFWDGIEIGRNGKVGTSLESEIPGKKTSHLKIPDSLLTMGVHEVELELSNYYAGDHPRFYVLCAIETFEIGRTSLVRTSYIHIYAGCFLIIGLFYIVRFITNRSRYTHLVFSSLSILFFTLIMVEYMRYYVYYDYSWHFTRLKIILGITLGIGVLLPLFFLMLFNIKHKWKILSLIFLVEILTFYTIPYGYDYATSLVILSGFSSSTIITILGYRKKRLESFLSLTGLIPVIIALLIWPIYYDYIIYIGFGNLTVIMLVLLALKDKKIREEKERTSLRSARLELELLKKNIQPHFMKNSLTTAIDWIERNPAKGIELIYALVEEFDLLLNISDKQMIPLQQEIELCRKHLQIMSFRKEMNYSLEVVNIPPEADILIPPAILLTVIENGITHNQSDSRDINFIISRTVDGQVTTYEIKCEGKYSSSISSIEGTGTKYIKARLEENFKGCWEYLSEPLDRGWMSTLRWKE